MNQQLTELFNQESLCAVKANKVIATSLRVAEIFGKRHDNVLRDIQNLECSKEFSALNFEGCDYIGENRKTLPMYEMTKDGFTFLVMGYTGEKAAQFKEAYIGEFNRMEKALRISHAKKLPTPHDIFYKNHNLACRVLKERTARLRYANELTIEQTGFDVLTHAKVFLPEQNPALSVLLAKTVDDKTLRQLIDSVHYQHLDQANAKSILIGLWLRVHNGNLYIGNKCPLVDDRKALQEISGATRNAAISMNHQTTRATIINIY